MLSYDGVIRKRLRLKGHPEIPEYCTPQSELAAAAEAKAQEETNGATEVNRPSDEVAANVELKGEASADGQRAEGEHEVDARTDAQKRHDKVATLREKERLRKLASQSYREKVDDFNKRLAEEPEHYDLFKTSFTK